VSSCCTCKCYAKRLVILGFALAAALAVFTDWEMTSMSRIWETSSLAAQVAKLSALVLNSNATGGSQAPPEGALTTPGELRGQAAKPTRPPREDGQPKLYRHGAECKEQAVDLGTVETPVKCGDLVIAKPQCGAHFMFSVDHPDWHCRCCTPGGADGGPQAPWWDIYQARRAPSNGSEASTTARDGGPSGTAPAPTAQSPAPSPPDKPDRGNAAAAKPPVLAPPDVPDRGKAATAKLPSPAPPDAPDGGGSDKKAPAPAAPPAPPPKPPPAPAKAAPTAPPPGKYKPAYHARSIECAEQAYSFGNIPTIEACDKLTATTQECGNHFMFSVNHPDWQCRCCAPFGEDDGPTSPHWDVYDRLYPRSATLGALPTSPPMVNPFHGLPIDQGARPAWLVREDALVVDARTANHGGILILQAVLTDVNSLWGAKRSAEKARPEWLRAILATNRAHAKKHGHAMVLRAQPTQPQLTPWMVRACGDKSTNFCVRQNERENFNWEKHLMISDYLASPQNFSHVLMLDADAALIQPQLDTLRRIAAILDGERKDLFLTDEDWLDANGKGRINGGLMYAKNTNFTRNLFLDTFAAHVKGPAQYKNWRIGIPVMSCTSNEQICLNDLWHGQWKEYFKPHAMMASGKLYNRGAERGGEQHMTDPTTEVMHWMGGSKGSAGRALCRGARDLTFGGMDGYGCKQ